MTYDDLYSAIIVAPPWEVEPGDVEAYYTLEATMPGAGAPGLIAWLHVEVWEYHAWIGIDALGDPVCIEYKVEPVCGGKVGSVLRLQDFANYTQLMCDLIIAATRILKPKPRN